MSSRNGHKNLSSGDKGSNIHKTIVKYRLMILGIFVVLCCKAQQIYSLKTDYTEIRQNSYLKDLNNELDSFIGTWQGSFNGNLITLFITKESHKFFNENQYKYYKDILSIKYIVKNASRIVLQNTQSMTFQANQLTHTQYTVNGQKIMVIVFYCIMEVQIVVLAGEA
jgi:hypothetical protein